MTIDNYTTKKPIGKLVVSKIPLKSLIGEKSFFEIIENRIKEKGISVTKLINIAGISHSAYYMTKKRKSNPRPLTRKAICQALNLNPETLEPIELPKRSAWDDIKDGADIIQTGGWQGCHVILFGDIEKYKDELKRLPAKD